MKKKFKQVLMGCNNPKLSDCSMVTDAIIDLLLIVECPGFNCKKNGEQLRWCNLQILHFYYHSPFPSFFWLA